MILRTLLRAMRRGRYALAMALFVALMRYVLERLSTAQYEVSGADSRPESTAPPGKEETKRPGFLSGPLD